MKTFTELGTEIGALVEEKNKAYGDSFACCGEFLKLLYPQGIMLSQYQDMLALVRMFDKMKRIATDKDAFGESPFRDLAGYALLGVANQKPRTVCGHVWPAGLQGPAVCQLENGHTGQHVSQTFGGK